MQQREVFTLGFNHGTNPRNTTYAYIIAPGITSARQMNAYNKKTQLYTLMYQTKYLILYYQLQSKIKPTYLRNRSVLK